MAFVAVACALVASPGQARAEARDNREGLRDAVDRVVAAWRATGAVVAVDRSRFLGDDQTLAVTLPALPEGNCTTVLFLGTRGLGFHVSASGDGESGPHVPSEAGALTLEQCGEPLPSRLLLTSDSGRGALETLVARSAQPLPAVAMVLPERTGGGLGPLPDPGALPPLPPPDKRAELAELRAKRDGASPAPRAVWYSGPDGAGVGEALLAPGCHSLALFASEPAVPHGKRRAKLDLDAEMRDTSDDRLLARDRTDAPDAHLPVCVAEPTEVGIIFAGAPAGSPVLVSHVAWPLPAHLPSLWGNEARARMAEALLARHVGSLSADPVQLAQGGSGVTTVPVAVQPGGCYLAVVALVQGGARAVGLRVHVAARDYFDDRGVDSGAAAVAFCSVDRSSALAEVDVHGAPMAGWGLAIYRIAIAANLESGAWEPTQ